VTDKKNKQTDKLGHLAPRGVDPRSPNFQGMYVEVEAHYIIRPNTIWVRLLFTELGPKNPQKADFAMKRTNICRLSGDIIKHLLVVSANIGVTCLQLASWHRSSTTVRRRNMHCACVSSRRFR